MTKQTENQNVFSLQFPSDTTDRLLSFYDKDHRRLPWRENITPYRTLVSEIMLQQTRVEAVLAGDYFGRFLSAFPDVRSLAVGSEELLLKLWQGLGYYSRAKNLQKAAVTVCEKFDGVFPSSVEQLKTLPGVGDYTAAAVSSIAFGIPSPAVDGNVLRVLARLSACKQPLSLGDTTLRKDAAACLRPILSETRAGDFTQAMMELGATVCLPTGRPRCEVCPFAGFCQGCREGDPKIYPLRKPKTPRTVVPMTVLILRDTATFGTEDRFYLRRRPAKGLLASLYEFPGVPGKMCEEEAAAAAAALGFAAETCLWKSSAKHIFSHLEWHMTLYEFEGRFLLPSLSDGCVLATQSEIGSLYAVPSAFAACLSRISGSVGIP